MKTNRKHRLIVIGLAIYLLLPLVGTLLYSIAGKWSITILPETWTFEWYIQLFQDERFILALLRSIFVIICSVMLSLIMMLLAIFTVILYFPKQEKILQTVSMLPYGIPGVVSAVGLLQLYSSSSIKITGTPLILIGIYSIVLMPFMFQGIRNSIYTVNAVELVQSAELLGASRVKAVITTVIPNIMKGVIAPALLGVAMLFGEFVFANLLVGSQFETLQIYLYQQLNKNGHLTSAIVITYYTVIIIITGLLIGFQSSNKKRKKRMMNIKPLNKLENKTIEGDIQ